RDLFRRWRERETRKAASSSLPEENAAGTSESERGFPPRNSESLPDSRTLPSLEIIIAPALTRGGRSGDYVKPLIFQLRRKLGRYPTFSLAPPYAWAAYSAGNETRADILLAVRPRPERDTPERISFYLLFRDIRTGREKRSPIDWKGTPESLDYNALADEVLRRFVRFLVE
ncbi:MAG: hypothetical protein D6679_06400, partial [Candidatus Hydrogenedentota bacterium]